MCIQYNKFEGHIYSRLRCFTRPAQLFVIEEMVDFVIQLEIAASDVNKYMLYSVSLLSFISGFLFQLITY